MRQHFLKHGTVDERSQGDSQKGFFGFHLEKWLKRALKAYNVPTFDNCCDTADSVQPLRYNAVDDQLERFDGTEWVLV